MNPHHTMSPYRTLKVIITQREVFAGPILPDKITLYGYQVGSFSSDHKNRAKWTYLVCSPIIYTSLNEANIQGQAALRMADKALGRQRQRRKAEDAAFLAAHSDAYGHWDTGEDGDHAS